MAEQLIPTSTINGICKRIVDSLHPVRVILFGSYATGKATSDSDLDFLVVTRTPLKKKVITSQIKPLLDDDLRSTPMDVIAVDYTEYEESKDVIGGLPYTASKYGKIIYENTRSGQMGLYPSVA